MNGLPEYMGQEERRFRTLRVSLTAGCNLSCTYCTDGKELRSAGKSGDYRQLAEMILQLHQHLELDTIRFTGGEPLLYRELLPLVRMIHSEAKTVSLNLSTNGYLLASSAYALAEAGIRSLNVSLDAVEEDVFYRISRTKGLQKVLEGIRVARERGIEVKINSVIMKGVNESQIVPLFRYGCVNGIPLRYLELMKMGHLHANYKTHFFSMREILGVLRSAGIGYIAEGRPPHGTACYWRTRNGYHFGIIANETVPFCHDCNRLRLDSRGNLYGCLSTNRPIPISAILGDPVQLSRALREALSHKKQEFSGSTLSMMQIGG